MFITNLTKKYPNLLEVVKSMDSGGYTEAIIKIEAERQKTEVEVLNELP
jgi:hypothetical protein